MPRTKGAKGVNSGEWKTPFLVFLRKYPNVMRASRHVGVSRALVYREIDGDPQFRAEFEEAKAEGIENIEGVAMELASNRDSKNNGLRIFMLRSLKPEVYGDKSQVTLKGSKEEPLEVHSQNDSTDRIASILTILAEAGGLTSGAERALPAPDDPIYAGDNVGEAGSVPPSI